MAIETAPIARGCLTSADCLPPSPSLPPRPPRVQVYCDGVPAFLSPLVFMCVDFRVPKFVPREPPNAVPPIDEGLPDGDDGEPR